MITGNLASLKQERLRQPTAEDNRSRIPSFAKFNGKDLRLLTVSRDKSLQVSVAKMGLTNVYHQTDYSENLMRSIQSGAYNCLVIDANTVDIDLNNLLAAHAQKPPFTPVILINADAQLLMKGAADCIPIDQLTPERFEAALYNAGRLHSLNKRTSRLEHELATYIAKDPLTTLQSRSKFRVAMADAINIAHESQSPLSLIILDIDGFKGLNESRGHRFGDQILKAIAERLFRYAPENAILGRLGDDEFALLVQAGRETSPSDMTIAVKLSNEIRQPYRVSGQNTELSATLGIAELGPQENADVLLHKAISALYSAKRDKSRFMLYTEKDDVERRQQLGLARDLSKAIKEDHLRLHFQPMIQMSRSQIVGVEALVRWAHPKLGLLFPDSFIPLAEESGSIEALTRWVLDAAVRQGSQWLEMGRELSVSVNISALTLHNPSFPDAVEAILQRWNFPARLLKMEITESAIISDVVRATAVVKRLHEMGVKVSIDDFGTGYTSLSYIRKLPVDEIKIDKSFVLNMNNVDDDAVIVRTLLELAKNLGLSVVAEGVEDRETWYMLAGLGCHIAQGYYMSRPVDLEAFEAWYKTSPWARD